MLWAQVNRIVRFALIRGWIKSCSLPVRVMSVGNLQSGGAGKTPLVAQIAKEAHEKGLLVCILSRGYRGAWERAGGVIAPEDSTVDPRQCGDEPALLHALCPFAWLGVGANRVLSFGEVVKRLGKNPDLVLLDDGFQHWKIRKDLEIVAVTGDLPSQRVFRESWGALQNADLVVWTKGEKLPSPIRALPSLKICHVSYQWTPFFQDEGIQPQASQKWWLVTAIADSQSAYDLALRAGYSVIQHRAFADHFQFSVEKVEELLAQAHQSGVKIVITGKDWVKWRALGVNQSQVHVIEPQLKWVEGQEVWTQVLWERE